MQDELILIENKQGVSIYGRVMKSGRLGKFRVVSSMLGWNGIEYFTYAEAEDRFKKIVGVNKP